MRHFIIFIAAKLSDNTGNDFFNFCESGENYPNCEEVQKKMFRYGNDNYRYSAFSIINILELNEKDMISFNSQKISE